jgi:tRNA(fMet)-specific endonuclease VapC
MPGSSLIFDTNAFIAWCFEDADLARQAVLYSEPTLTLISMGELVFGALKSTRPAANREDLNRRLRGFRILMPDTATADAYGEICFALRRKGRPIPENDIWIAALALQHGLPLLTRDAHFREVEGLNVLGW